MLHMTQSPFSIRRNQGLLGLVPAVLANSWRRSTRAQDRQDQSVHGSPFTIHGGQIHRPCDGELLALRRASLIRHEPRPHEGGSMAAMKSRWLVSLTGCLVLAACGGSSVAGGPSAAVDRGVLDIHVSGSWSGDMHSPRSLNCGVGAGFNARWAGTLGDRIVQLDLVNNSRYPWTGTVVVPGGTSGGATRDPQVHEIFQGENLIAATLEDKTTTERHFLGGTMVIAADGRSGTLELKDADLRLAGSWRC